MNAFLSLTELGKLFGVTSHKVGKWLVECGLRNERNKPTKRAFDEGIVTTTSTNRGSQGGYYNNNSGNWRFTDVGFSGTPAVVPEPSSLLLASIAGGLLVAYTRGRRSRA